MRQTSKPTRILIAYDGSGYSHTSLDDLKAAGLPLQAEALIISVAERWLTPKMVGSVVGASTDQNIAEYFQTHSEQMHRNLAETEAILVEAKRKLQGNFPNWTVSAEAHSGSPSEVVLERVSQLGPDLVVVGARGLSSDGSSGLGSISQKILSESRVPVRIVRSGPERSAGHHKIAICFDGSPCSQEAVRALVQRNWHERPKVKLMVVTDPLIASIPGRVLRVVQGLAEGRTKGEAKWIELLIRKAAQILRTAGFSTSVQICSGNPRIMLVAECKKWKSNMIFVGANSGRSGSQSLGCVASAVASRAFCTVETIRRAKIGDNRIKRK